MDLGLDGKVILALGLRGSPNASPHSASKHGVIGLTRTAAIEYAQRGIRVNAVVWLLSGAASFITGESLAVEGGLLSR